MGFPENSKGAGGVTQTAIQRLLDRPLTAEDVSEATERVSHAIQPPEQNVQSLLLFVLKGEWFAVPVTSVQCVTEMSCVHRIPHRSNRVIRGFCNVDGELVLCADLANLLDLRSDSSAPEATPDPELANSRRTLVLIGSNGPWAIEIDMLARVERCDPRRFQHPPLTVEHAKTRYTSHLVRIDEGHAALLDVERLLTGFEVALP